MNDTRDTTPIPTPAPPAGEEGRERPAREEAATPRPRGGTNGIVAEPAPARPEPESDPEPGAESFSEPGAESDAEATAGTATSRPPAEPKPATAARKPVEPRDDRPEPDRTGPASAEPASAEPADAEPGRVERDRSERDATERDTSERKLAAEEGPATRRSPETAARPPAPERSPEPAPSRPEPAPARSVWDEADAARSRPAGPEPAGEEPDPEPEPVDLEPPRGPVIPEPVRASGSITRGAIADSARMVILGRIKTALADVPAAERPHHVRVLRNYRTVEEAPRAEVVSRFVARVSGHGATVQRVAQERLSRAILEACRARGVRRLAVPSDLPDAWRPGYAEVMADGAEAPLDLAALDAADGVLTACSIAIADTGTVVLDGGDWQGRRAVSLVPDYHLCVVHVDQIVGTVPEAVAALAEVATHPLTFISGPSATSDIELDRVEGVHGPRTLDVLLVS